MEKIQLLMFNYGLTIFRRSASATTASHLRVILFCRAPTEIRLQNNQFRYNKYDVQGYVSSYLSATKCTGET